MQSIYGFFNISSLYLIYYNNLVYLQYMRAKSWREYIGNDLGREVLRKHARADGHAAQAFGAHCRGACPGASSYGQRHPRASCGPRARRHCAAKGFGAPWKRGWQAGLRLRIDAAGRGSIPESLRAGAAPVAGCPERADGGGEI